MPICVLMAVSVSYFQFLLLQIQLIFIHNWNPGCQLLAFQKKLPISGVDCTSINQIKTICRYYVQISNQHTTSLGTLFYQGSKACISSRKKDNRNSYGL